LVQTGGWFYILASIGKHYAEHHHHAELWATIGTPVRIFQYLAILEIVHAVLGLVRTPVATTLVQVFSRVMLVVLTSVVPDAQKHWILTVMLSSWAITEVVRYLFYALNQSNKSPYWLGWLRYSLFLVLYPSGVGGEVGTILVSLNFVKDAGWIPLYYFLICTFPGYAVGLPWLYSHMLSQRKRFIGGSSSKPNKKKVH